MRTKTRVHVDVLGLPLEISACWAQRRALARKRCIDGGWRAGGAALLGDRTVVGTWSGVAEAMTMTMMNAPPSDKRLPVRPSWNGSGNASACSNSH